MKETTLDTWVKIQNEYNEKRLSEIPYRFAYNCKTWLELEVSAKMFNELVEKITIYIEEADSMGYKVLKERLHSVNLEGVELSHSKWSCRTHEFLQELNQQTKEGSK